MKVKVGIIREELLRPEGAQLEVRRAEAYVGFLMRSRETFLLTS